jgi:hypothetical protein
MAIGFLKLLSLTIQKMSKKINMIQVSGQAVFTSDENKNEYVQFLPDDPVEQFIKGWRHEGVAQRLRNGTFDFVARPRIRSAATLIKKVAHGRLSATKDGAIQLTLKIFKSEGVPMADTFIREAEEAVSNVKL